MFRKFYAITAVILSIAVITPVLATANSGLGGLLGAKAKSILKIDPTVAADRAKIAQLNVDVLALKLQAKELIQKIRFDLAGTKGDDSITASQDYKDIVALLQNLKGTLGKAEKRDYVSGLKHSFGKNSKDQHNNLENVITVLTQKKTDLAAAIDNLKAALVKADKIAALKTTSSSATNSDLSAFKAQAEPKKQTIDSNRAKIVQAFAEDKNLVSTIIATAAANKTVLQGKPEVVSEVTSKLAEITKSLKPVCDGDVLKAQAQFKTDIKNKDYTAALTDLDKIISVQQARLTTLASIKIQLQDVLTQLNNAVS